MDAEQFDALIRSLSAAASRRRVLSALPSRLLAALPLGLFALDGAERAGAKRKKKKKKKKKKWTLHRGRLHGWRLHLPPPPAEMWWRMRGRV